MRPAEARLAASMSSNSSIRWSLTGAQVDWMRKTSAPRTDSSKVMEVSPSLKVETTALPTGSFKFSAICLDSRRLAVREKTWMRLPCTFISGSSFLPVRHAFIIAKNRPVFKTFLENRGQKGAKGRENAQPLPVKPRQELYKGTSFHFFEKITGNRAQPLV